jgi:hypothetical protein
MVYQLHACTSRLHQEKGAPVSDPTPQPPEDDSAAQGPSALDPSLEPVGARLPTHRGEGTAESKTADPSAWAGLPRRWRVLGFVIESPLRTDNLVRLARYALVSVVVFFGCVGIVLHFLPQVHVSFPWIEATGGVVAITSSVTWFKRRTRRGGAVQEEETTP